MMRFKETMFQSAFCVAVLSCLLSVIFVTSLRGEEAGSPLHRISVQTPAGERSWSVELASDEASRSKGLMFRREMADDAGMLFRFDATRPVAMWMKNTFISLDMIFLKENGRISSIHYGAVPQSLDVIASREPVRYVLEINAGIAKKAGLEAGQIMRHPWFSVTN